MSKVFNMVGGGSGKNISSIIITGLKSTDTVTCAKDGKSYTATWDDTDQKWEIVGLPLGTFTITATHGTKTITETVLIDIAGVYEIEMSFKLWLYNEGDECEELTGGFVYDKGGQTNFTLTKGSAYLEGKISSVENGVGSTFGTANPINFSGYSKLCIRHDYGGTANWFKISYFIGAKALATTTNLFGSILPNSSASNTDVLSEVALDYEGEYYFSVFVDTQSAGQNVYDKIYKIWLE